MCKAQTVFLFGWCVDSGGVRFSVGGERQMGIRDGSWIALTSRASICADDCLVPLEAGEEGDAESSHSLPHSPPQAWQMRLEMAVAIDSPFGLSCRPDFLWMRK